MSENKHTPEPWRAFNNGEGVVGVGTDHSDVCWTRIEEGGWLDSDRTIDTDYENARRIVACINACAGIDTELLEIIEDNDKTLAGVIANVEKQRDELLAALEGMLFIDADNQRGNDDEDVCYEVRQARSTIASVKGGAA